MLVRIKIDCHDKNNTSVTFNAGEVVEVESAERAEAMIANGYAEKYQPKVLAEPAEEKTEVVKEDAKPTTRKRKAGAKD